jgi:hypothetical protein
LSVARKPSEQPFSANPVIGIRSGDWVDAVNLNGVRHGGEGGEPTARISLNEDDYWSEFEVCSRTVSGLGPFGKFLGESISFISLTSEQGQHIEGGRHLRGEKCRGARGIRLLRIGGKSGSYLDNIKLEFVENFRPSQKVDPDATAILDFSPGGKTITTYENQRFATAQAYERITESLRGSNISIGAEAEYFAKFSASTQFETTDTTRNSIKTTTEQELRSGTSTEQTIAPDQVAVFLSNVTIMMDPEGNPWMHPNYPPSWVFLKPDRFKDMRGKYDLTGGAAVQFGLNTKLVNGYRLLVD